jgi:hypothetical protein
MISASLPLPSLARANHNTLREGVTAGFLGATGVALWLLIVDMANGRPLYTPSTLGYGLFTLFATTPPNTMASVAFYTIFHYAAFTAVGLALVAAIHASRAHPPILALMLILFMCFQLGFYGLVALLAQSRLGDLAWYQVGLANLVATVLMGVYLWRTHPLLRGLFGEGLVGDEEADERRAAADAHQ